MLLRWIRGCGPQSGLGRLIEGVGRKGGGFLRIAIRCYCLRTKFLSIGLLLLRLSLQGESKFLTDEIGLDLTDSGIGLVFLLAKEGEAALVIQPLFITPNSLSNTTAYLFKQ